MKSLAIEGNKQRIIRILNHKEYSCNIKTLN